MARDDARFLELLDRWLTGAFTRADERELQALAAADPFRREAWEGFASLPETEHAALLERLRARLQPQRRKRVPLGIWLAAAATLALLFFVVLFLPRPEVENAAPLANAPASEQQTEAKTRPSDTDTVNSALEAETRVSAPSVSNQCKKSAAGD